MPLGQGAPTSLLILSRGTRRRCARNEPRAGGCGRMKQLTDNLLQCIIVGSKIQPHGTRFPRQNTLSEAFVEAGPDHPRQP
jgi:hypothetical protein